MATLEDLQKQIKNLTSQAKAVHTDRRERYAQKNYWAGVSRSYQKGYQVHIGSGKYYSSGGRKNRYASLSDYKTAQHFLKKIIPPHITRLTKQHETLTAQISKKKPRLAA